MAYTASIIADAFVKKGIESGKFVTQMKLQKIVFFAHGYHLAKYNKPLITEQFEAWKYGPVVPGIYHHYKPYGSSPITQSYDHIYRLDVNEDYDLDIKARDAVDNTWEITKNIEAMVLSNWTHSKKSPWSRVYNPDEWSRVIDNSLIKEYFVELLTKEA